MSLEIERKFLLKELPKNLSNKSSIIQGYLWEKPLIRIRKKDNQSFLTIKNKSFGLIRKEWEFSIPNFLFSLFINFCKFKISKIRFKHISQELIWEVDYFNHDLIIAEVEIPNDSFTLKNPFLDLTIKEITDDPYYSNLSLAKNIKD